MQKQLLEVIMNVKEEEQCYGRCVVGCLVGRHGFQLHGSKSSCGFEGPVEVKVGAG